MPGLISPKLCWLLHTASPTSVEWVSQRILYGGWQFAKDRKESREYAMGLFLLSTYKRRPPTIKGNTHIGSHLYEGEEHQTKSNTITWVWALASSRIVVGRDVRESSGKYRNCRTSSTLYLDEYMCLNRFSR